MTGGADTVIRTFPALEKVPAGFEMKGEEGRFTVYEEEMPGKSARSFP